MNIQESFKIRKDTDFDRSYMEGSQKYYGFCEFINSMYSKDNIDICLDDIDKIRTEVLKEVFLDGPAFGVTVTKDKVVSENLLTCQVYSEELLFDEFDELFLMWASHCKKEYF